MTDLTTMMVDQSLDAFVNLNTDQAKRVMRLDDEVDRYNEEIIQEIIRAMQKSPDLIDPGLSMFGNPPPGANCRPRDEYCRGCFVLGRRRNRAASGRTANAGIDH